MYNEHRNRRKLSHKLLEFEFRMPALKSKMEKTIPKQKKMSSTGVLSIKSNGGFKIYIMLVIKGTIILNIL